MVTVLASGFALSVQPVSAETISTDEQGLTAGEVQDRREGRPDAGIPRDAK